MANRAKKDATIALKQLQGYLRRDQLGLKLLTVVQQYLREGQQKRAAIRDSCEAAERVAARAKEDRIITERKLTELHKQFTQVTAKNRQLKRDAAGYQQEIADLQQALAPWEAPLPDEEPVRLNNKARFFAFTKLVMKRVPRVPKPISRANTDHLVTLDLLSLVKSYNSADYQTLGMFVMLITLWGYPLQIRLEDKELAICNLGLGFEDKDYARFVHWMGSWIAVPNATTKKLLDIIVEEKTSDPAGAIPPKIRQEQED